MRPIKKKEKRKNFTLPTRYKERKKEKKNKKNKNKNTRNSRFDPISRSARLHLDDYLRCRSTMIAPRPTRTGRGTAPGKAATIISIVYRARSLFVDAVRFRADVGSNGPRI